MHYWHRVCIIVSLATPVGPEKGCHRPGRQAKNGTSGLPQRGTQVTLPVAAGAGGARATSHRAADFRREPFGGRQAQGSNCASSGRYVQVPRLETLIDAHRASPYELVFAEIFGLCRGNGLIL